MRTRTSWILPILAIVVGFGMIVGAATIIRLSNVVENQNNVGLPVVLQLNPTTATPGGDLPNYVAGSVMQSQAYDMQVSYTTSKALNDAAIIVEFSKTGINATDVLMEWTASTTWTSITWTDNGDTLRGTLGAVGSQGIGAVNYLAKLTYNVQGDFTFKVWVEGSMSI